MIDDVTMPVAMPPMLKTDDPAKLRAAAEEFEGVFLAQMLAPMFAGTAAEAPFGGGHAEDTWRSLQIDEFGKAIARAGGVGLADHVYREMLALQEGAGR